MANMNIAITITGYDMASGPIAAVTRAVGGMAESTNASTSAVSGLGDALQKVVTIAAGINLSRMIQGGLQEAFSALSDTIFGFNGRLEQSQIAWGTFLNSATAGKKMIVDLQQFAAETPFRFNGLDLAARDMVAMGFAGKDILALMHDIASAAAATGRGQEGFDRISYTLSEIQALGHVDSRLMRQLALDGVPAWEILSETMHKSVGELRELAKAGNIPASTFLGAFHDFTTSHWGDMLEQQAHTFLGALTTIQDNLQIAGARGFQPLFDRVSELTVAFGKFTQTQGFMDFADTVNTGLEAILSTMDRINPRIMEFIAISAGLTGVVAGVSALARAYQAAATAIMDFKAVQMASFLGSEQATMEGVTGISILRIVPPLAIAATAVTAFAVGYETNFLGLRDTTDRVVGRVKEDVDILSKLLADAQRHKTALDLINDTPQQIGKKLDNTFGWQPTNITLPQLPQLPKLPFDLNIQTTGKAPAPFGLDASADAAVQKITAANDALNKFMHVSPGGTKGLVDDIDRAIQQAGKDAERLDPALDIGVTSAADKAANAVSRIDFWLQRAKDDADALASSIALAQALSGPLAGATLIKPLAELNDPVLQGLNATLDASQAKLEGMQDAATKAKEAHDALGSSIKSEIPGLRAFDAATEALNQKLSGVQLIIERKKLARLEGRNQDRPQVQALTIEEQLKVRGLERDVTFGGAIQAQQASGQTAYKAATNDANDAIKNQKEWVDKAKAAVKAYQVELDTLTNWNTNIIPLLSKVDGYLTSQFLLLNQNAGAEFQKILAEQGPDAALAYITGVNNKNLQIQHDAAVSSSIASGAFNPTDNPVLDHAKQVAILGYDPEKIATNAGIPLGGQAGFAHTRGLDLTEHQKQALQGYAEGGSWMVGGQGGTDSQLVQFMASPDERVSVQTPEQQYMAGEMTDAQDAVGSNFGSMLEQLAKGAVSKAQQVISGVETQIIPEGTHGTKFNSLGSVPALSGGKALEFILDNLYGYIDPKLIKFLPGNIIASGHNYADVMHTLNGVETAFRGKSAPHDSNAMWRGVSNYFKTQADTWAHTSVYNKSLNAGVDPGLIAHELGHNVQNMLHIARGASHAVIRDVLGGPEFTNPGSAINDLYEQLRGPSYNVGKNPREFLSQVLQELGDPQQPGAGHTTVMNAYERLIQFFNEANMTPEQLGHLPSQIPQLFNPDLAATTLQAGTGLVNRLGNGAITAGSELLSGSGRSRLAGSSPIDMIEGLLGNAGVPGFTHNPDDPDTFYRGGKYNEYTKVDPAHFNKTDQFLGPAFYNSDSPKDAHVYSGDHGAIRAITVGDHLNLLDIATQSHESVYGNAVAKVREVLVAELPHVLPAFDQLIGENAPYNIRGLWQTVAGIVSPTEDYSHGYDNMNNILSRAGFDGLADSTNLLQDNVKRQIGIFAESLHKVTHKYTGDPVGDPTGIRPLDPVPVRNSNRTTATFDDNSQLLPTAALLDAAKHNLSLDAILSSLQGVDNTNEYWSTHVEALVPNLSDLSESALKDVKKWLYGKYGYGGVKNILTAHGVGPQSGKGTSALDPYGYIVPSTPMGGDTKIPGIGPDVDWAEYYNDSESEHEWKPLQDLVDSDSYAMQLWQHIDKLGFGVMPPIDKLEHIVGDLPKFSPTAMDILVTAFKDKFSGVNPFEMLQHYSSYAQSYVYQQSDTYVSDAIATIKSWGNPDALTDAQTTMLDVFSKDASSAQWQEILDSIVLPWEPPATHNPSPNTDVDAGLQSILDSLQDVTLDDPTAKGIFDKLKTSLNNMLHGSPDEGLEGSGSLRLDPNESTRSSRFTKPSNAFLGMPTGNRWGDPNSLPQAPEGYTRFLHGTRNIFNKLTQGNPSVGASLGPGTYGTRWPGASAFFALSERGQDASNTLLHPNIIPLDIPNNLNALHLADPADSGLIQQLTKLLGLPQIPMGEEYTGTTHPLHHYLETRNVPLDAPGQTMHDVWTRFRNILVPSGSNYAGDANRTLTTALQQLGLEGIYDNGAMTHIPGQINVFDNALGRVRNALTGQLQGDDEGLTGNGSIYLDPNENKNISQLNTSEYGFKPSDLGKAPEGFTRFLHGTAHLFRHLEANTGTGGDDLGPGAYFTRYPGAADLFSNISAVTGKHPGDLPEDVAEMGEYMFPNVHLFDVPDYLNIHHLTDTFSPKVFARIKEAIGLDHLTRPVAISPNDITSGDSLTTGFNTKLITPWHNLVDQITEGSKDNSVIEEAVARVNDALETVGYHGIYDNGKFTSIPGQLNIFESAMGHIKNALSGDLLGGPSEDELDPNAVNPGPGTYLQPDSLNKIGPFVQQQPADLNKTGPFVNTQPDSLDKIPPFVQTQPEGLSPGPFVNLTPDWLTGLFGGAHIQTTPPWMPGGPHFATGGSWMVGGAGGTDSQYVGFHASPNERVTVETPEQVQRGNGVAFSGPLVGTIHIHDAADEDRLMAKLNDFMVQLTGASGMASGKAQYQLGGAR